jgi:hypothetical protein
MAVMGEPLPAAGETAPDSGETVAVPGSAGPDAIDRAWSREDKGNESEPAANRQSWQTTWRKAGALFLAGLAVAGAIVLAFWLLSPETPQPPAKSGATPTSSTTAAAPSAPPPSTIVSTPDQDKKYVQALNDRGISFANPEAAIYNGKMVCHNLGEGMTVAQVVGEFRASNPALGADADTYVAISVHAYCPQNGNLVSGG